MATHLVSLLSDVEQALSWLKRAAASAAAAGKYKLAAGESAKQIEQAQHRGILPSELGGVTSPDVPKEGTPEYGVYLIQKASGVIK